MKKLIISTFLLISIMFTGCAEPKKPEPTLPPKPTFQKYIDLPDENWPPKENNITQSVDISDLNPIANNKQVANGKASIIGSISIYSPTGAIINGAYSNIYLRSLITTERGVTLGNYMQSTMSDKSGKFEFQRIPNGRYKISGSLNCGKECGYDTNKTITLSSIATLDRNSTYNIRLTNRKLAK